MSHVMERHLSEPDARKLATGIVERLRALGGTVSDFGVYLDGDGFYFVATVNGTRVATRTAQGAFTYQGVAADMLAYVLSPPPETPLFPEATL